MATYMKSEKTVTVRFGDGTVKTVKMDNKQAQSILDEARKLDWADEAVLLRMFDLAEAIRTYVQEMNMSVQGHQLVVKCGQVTLDGEVLGGVVVDRILAFAEEGLPPEPLSRFLVQLMANPSFNSRQQLYGFLEALNMPITERGTFLACKYVREDFTDCRTGKFDNHPGKVVEVKRSEVDDNPNNTCSKGLHVGAWEYVANSGAHRMLVEVDPADVVSVPTDYNGQKCRCCRYKVIDEITEAPPRGTFRPSEPTAPKHVCPSCGADIGGEREWDDEDETIVLCPACSVDICKECEVVIPSDANFCPGCGTNLSR